MATLATRNFTRFAVAPLTPTIGAEIGGIDLREPISNDDIADIRRALLTHKVLFLRDQDISEGQHIAFARRFGDLEIHPVTPIVQPHRDIFHLKTRPGGRTGADLWHSDVTWRAEPSLGSVLRCRILPPLGGDTMFADMVAAYEGLSPALKDWICTLTAVHDGSQFAVMQGKTRESFWEEFPLQEHPVVRTHPEARSTSTAPSPPTSKGLARRKATGCSITFFLRLPGPNINAASAGARTPSHSGTTAPASTMPWGIIIRQCAQWNG